jgi:hypothetical protein
MYAGQTLAQLAVAQLADPAGVLAELNARVARGGKSAKNAQKAIERMTAGASVAFPPSEPKAPKQANVPATTPAGTNPNAGLVAAQASKALAKAAATTQMPEKLAWAFACKALKAGGYPVPRHMSKAARLGTLAPKVSA